MSIWNTLIGPPLSDAVADEIIMTVEEEPEDRPTFKRVYKARLDNRARIEIDARTTMFGDRRFSGTLIQPNGNRVWFEPKRIAERILDPALVPLVRRAVDKAKARDDAFMDRRPDTFIDKTGARWQRA